MVTTSRQAVIVDADVLAAPMTRTLLMAVALQPGARFVVRWSLSVEAEAERALRRGQVKIADLRQRFDWGSTVLVPDASPEQIAAMVDTSQTDRHVLGAAAAAKIGVLVTRNVHDFGRADLLEACVCAVHPDAYLAAVTTPESYRSALEVMAATRSRPPNTPETLHAALGAGHPQVFDAMRDVFPGVAAAPSPHAPSAETFRGDRCLVCAVTLADPESLASGVDPGCRGRRRVRNRPSASGGLA